MPHIVPVREFETVGEMQAHAAAVRAKAFMPQPVFVKLPKPALPKVEDVVAATPEPVGPVILTEPKLTPRVDGFYALKDMVRVAAYCSGIPQRKLTSPVRTAGLAKARQIGFWLARNRTERSLHQIGEAFGGRDHTTALHGIRRVDAVIASAAVPLTDDPVMMGFRLWDLSWPRPVQSPFTIARPRS